MSNPRALRLLSGPGPGAGKAVRSAAVRSSLDFYENQIAAQRPIKVHFLPLFVLCSEKQQKCSAAIVHRVKTQARSDRGFKKKKCVPLLREDSRRTLEISWKHTVVCVQFIFSFCNAHLFFTRVSKPDFGLLFGLLSSRTASSNCTSSSLILRVKS